MLHAEYFLRKYQPQYNAGSTSANFILLSHIQTKASEHGMICSQSKEGNSVVILWLELLFFFGNVCVVLVSLVGTVFSPSNVREPKSADKILLRDTKEGKSSFHIFSL
jgi:hypothetical protein